MRTGSFLPNNHNLFLSGSYDTTVKLCDSRVPPDQAGTLTFDHGYPVQCVLIHPNGSTAISAGDSLIRIWDLISGQTARSTKALSHHQKTIMSLCWGDASASKLLSAGLDGLVKCTTHRAGCGR